MMRRARPGTILTIAPAPQALLFGILLGAAAIPSYASPPTSRSGMPAIEGVALDHSGRPVEGALVAAVPETQGSDEPSTRAAAYSVSSRDGRFRLAPLPSGPYSITATRRGLTAAYLGGKVLKPGKTLRVEVRFGSDGHVLRGVVRDHRGAAIPRAEIRAIRYSELAGDIFYGYADDAGSYEITVPVASYYLCAAVDGFQFEGVNTDAKIDRAVDLTLYPPVTPGPPPVAVVDWIGAYAIPLDTVEAGHPFDDLEPLRAAVGNARVVALGEATHGTREFFQLKHRMLEFLVARMGFNVFAIEAIMPEAFDVNDYVLTGRGDPEQALAGLYFWTWDTQEVLDLIRWMRQWNSDPAHKKKVKFYGFDMQQTPRAAKNALRVLRAIDPPQADKAAGILEVLANPYLSERVARAPAAAGARAQEIDSTLQVLAERFEARRPPDLRIAGERELAIARQNVRILQQWTAMMFREGPSARDHAMAANIQWILAHEGADAKMVVWAHNGHVSKADPNAGSDGMGSYLHAALGNDMVVFGFAFDRGGFQAIDGSSGRELKAFTVGPAREGSLDDAFSRAGFRTAALDLRRLPASGEVGDWFATRRPTRMIGAGYIDSLGERYYRPIVPPRHFDAILFVDSTTAARPNPRGERPRSLIAPLASNLDFEEGAVGSSPPGWTGPARLAADHYRAEIRKGDSRSGLLCGGLRSLGKRAYGEKFGTLSQLVDAAPFRGRRVRLSALVRVEPATPGDEAFLQIKVSGGLPGREEDLFYDGMEDRPIVAKEWQRYTIEGNVPANANTVSFGLAFVGDGSAWLDSVSLEPVEPSKP